MTRKTSLRVLPLLLVGLALIGGAWALRSSAWLHGYILRGKDVAELEAAVRQDPNDSLARYSLAKRYYLQGRFSDARDAYQEAIRLDPRNAEAHLGLGLSWMELGQMRQARDELEAALRYDNRLAWAEYYLGKIAWQQGNLKDALEHARRATQLDPRSDQAWYSLAICCIQLNRWDEAVDALHAALSRQERNARYHTSLGDVLAYRGKTDDARVQFEQALQVDPNYGPACALLGALYLHRPTCLDSLQKAQALLERATRLKTYHPEQLYLDLGDLYIRKREYSHAVEALRTSIKLDPRDEQPYYLLSRAERLAGNSAAAAEAQERFRTISRLHLQKDALESRAATNPKDASNRLLLARVYRDLGMRGLAERQYLAYLRMVPGAANASTELRQLLEQQQPPAPALTERQDYSLPPLH